MTDVKYRFEFQGVPEHEITAEGETYDGAMSKAKMAWLVWVKEKYPKLFGSFKLR